MIVNRRQLAAILGCQPTSIDKMVARGMPYVSRPATRRDEWQFSTKAAIEWLVGGTFLKGDEATAGSELATLRVEREREDIAWRRSQRQLREYEIAEKQGSTIHLDDLVMLFDEQNSVVKSLMQALPGRLAQRIAVETDPAVVERMIADEVDMALAQLSGETARDQHKAGQKK